MSNTYQHTTSEYPSCRDLKPLTMMRPNGPVLNQLNPGQLNKNIEKQLLSQKFQVATEILPEYMKVFVDCDTATFHLDRFSVRTVIDILGIYNEK